MARKCLIAAVTIAVVSISSIFTIPLTIFFVVFSNYDKIEDSLTLYYFPNNSTPVEEFSLNADVGNIEVQYTTKPIKYHAKVDLYVEIIGSNVKGKSGLDFFDIDWQNISDPIVFSIERKSDLEISSWSIQNLSIIVTLKADIVYDINLTVLEGNAEISVPFGVSVNNITVSSITGNIMLDFNHGIIGGTITGNTTNGNIILNVNDEVYFRDSAWVLTVGTGDINLEIYQYRDMGANVTCSAETTNGNIFIFYKDRNPNVGAIIETYGDVYMGRDPGILPIPPELFQGFQIGNQLIPPRPNEYFSEDYPTINNYEIFLINNVSDDSGKIYLLDLTSS